MEVFKKILLNRELWLYRELLNRDPTVVGFSADVRILSFSMSIYRYEGLTYTVYH